ncbi:phosphate transport system protein [Natronobacillus azotifigens]|uniref:Phosphate-specific transport system accessory protein PhoU n=1 Tax=Natronobacillus azotifigens TaxID=472978 RepID=A0A9J6R9M9_9BACI|nr:phosphate signaling complex protein PhoU [Natronobacillus azotifigens]
MVVRGQFELELNGVKKQVVELAGRAKQQLVDSVQSLYDADVEMAARVIETDKKLDEMDLSINESAILLIARQQPVASDLRKLIVAIRISTDLERMADNAKNIARSAIHIGGKQFGIDQSLADMCDVALRMIDLAIEAYEKEDIKSAKKLAELDDIIDGMYANVLQGLLEETATNAESIQLIMQIAFSARYIERFGDHLTNIAENVMYLVKGETFDLNG